MRHRVSGLKLGRETKHRKALWRNLTRQLVIYGSVQTTETKGKELKRMADKIVTKAKVDSIANRRLLHRYFGKRDVVNTLFEEVAPTFKDRSSGFTRLERMGRRSGDSAQMVTVTWVTEVVSTGTLNNPKPESLRVTAKKKPTKKASTSKKTAKKAAPAASKTAQK